MPLTHLLLVLELWNGFPTYKKSCWESSGVIRFDLRPLLQGQMRIAKHKNAYNSLIIGPRALGWLNQHVGNDGLGIFRCGRI